MDVLLLFSMLFEANFVCIILFFSGIFFYLRQVLASAGDTFVVPN